MPAMPMMQRRHHPMRIKSKKAKRSSFDGAYRFPQWQNSPPSIDAPSPDEIFGRAQEKSLGRSEDTKKRQSVIDVADMDIDGYPEYMRAPSPSTLPAPPLDWGRSCSENTKIDIQTLNEELKKFVRDALSPTTSTSTSWSQHGTYSYINNVPSKTPDFMRTPSPSCLPAPSFDWPSNEQYVTLNSGFSPATSSAGSEGSVSVLVTSAVGGAQVVCPRPSRVIDVEGWNVPALAQSAH
ncbi:unnamed protein product [Peniophora sp. CBMAI 1063]|nr:unnamed protein product [Peniophora sp. CBMAI 1063]